MKKINRKPLFYYSLLLFAAALPFSVALISIAAALALIFAFVSSERNSWGDVFAERKYLLLIVSIYLIHALGMLFCKDLAAGFYDLNKALPFLLVPLAFYVAPKLTLVQLRNVMQLFSLAVFFSALITFCKFYWASDQLLLDAQFIGFIHHIRFSLMIVLALSIQVYLLATRWKVLGLWYIAATIGTGLFMLYFLFWQQSLTGIMTFWAVLLLAIVLFTLHKSSLKQRLVSVLLLGLLLVMPAFYLYRVIDDFYRVDSVDSAQLPQQTALGNPYKHDLNNPFTENGHHIGLYFCESELRGAWNRRSTVAYDSLDENKYRISDTLIRYLTSRNLTKDDEGVSRLSDEEILYIESGVSNYLLATRQLSLYPRLYVSVWEIDNFMKTGNSNNKSLAQRIEYLKAGSSIWKDHFWFGVGTGNWKAAYKQAYHDMGSEMDESQYADAHNQYLAWLVRFGLIGAAAILFLLAYPMIQSGLFSNPLVLSFALILLISNLGDSNLDTHVGGYFFIFFYCLFYSNREQLKIES
ncbi:O-antigen ligase family protein [Mangrovibacterium lignilyticum]|uniref:O-antigen ligase family protein n=1 Tax=Mangrovibacterium lignilyticum TaxID=2668052 RepID=UPI0013D6579C|nr:O-antigen ligase family protein [Mangrovibacterium lignilyticum]